MEFEQVMDGIARGFEAVGVAIIVVGGIGALIRASKAYGDMDHFFLDVRRWLGRPIILGLEVLVAADIIKTVTVHPSLESVAVLGILVAVRIALSFSLDIEVDGVAPWRRAQTEGHLVAGEADTDERGD